MPKTTRLVRRPVAESRAAVLVDTFRAQGVFCFQVWYSKPIRFETPVRFRASQFQSGTCFADSFSSELIAEGYGKYTFMSEKRLVTLV